MAIQEPVSEEKPIKVKTKFLEVVKSADAKAFLEFSDQHKSKRSPFKYEQLLSSLSDEELVESWKAVLDLVQEHAKNALQVDKSSAVASDVDMSTDVIQAAAQLGIITFDHLSKVPIHMLQTILFLHDVLLNFDKDQQAAQDVISKLCEKFWISNADGREELVANTIIYLLKRSLDVKFKKVDIKRVWLLKDCIRVVLEKEDSDKELLQFYLYQCVASSGYLSLTEGVKFIEFLLCLDEAETVAYHKKIKLKFQRRSQKECLIYGTIYFNAWMHATKANLNVLREKLEVDCIQDLMFHAVYVQRNRPKSLFPLLRKLLSVFNEKKKEYKVAKMLRTLFEPILWRGLKNASGSVRANAADIFFDFFPLENPDMNIAESEVEIQRQLLLIKDLLYDECPTVRAISAVGVCLVMAYHWDLLSLDMVKTFFKILIADLSVDSSSADVRCAVIKGLRVLVVECESAIPHLKVILPKFKGMFHDVSEKVRVLFCHLLLAVKKVRFIKYWDIVPEDHLLARLEDDKPPVQKLLVELMYTSYLPANRPAEVWLDRCLRLIKNAPDASKVFFHFLPRFTDLKSIVKFMTSACQVLHVHFSSKVKTTAKKASKNTKSRNKENQDGNEVVATSDGCSHDLDDPALVAALLDTLSVLWVSVQTSMEKPENKELSKELVSGFAMCMPLLLKYFKDSNIWKQVFFLCAFIPPSLIPVLSDMCFARLLEIPDDANVNDYKVLFVCLCYHDKIEEVLELIQKWIHHGISRPQDTPAKPKAKRKRKTWSDGATPKPMLAIKFLELLINDSLCQEAISRCDSLQDQIREEITIVQGTILNSKRNLNDEDKKLLFFSSFSVLTKVAVLLQAKKEKSDEVLRSMLSWATENFLTQQPVSSSKRQSSRPSKAVDTCSVLHKDLGSMICDDLYGIASDVVQAGKATESVEDYLKFIKAGLESGSASSLLSSAAMLGCRLSKNNKFIRSEKDVRDNNFTLLQDIFHLICRSAIRDKVYEEASTEQRNILKTELKEFLQSLIKSESMPVEGKKALVLDLFNHAAECIMPTIEKIEPDDTELRFPPVAFLLLSLISGNELVGFLVQSLPTWIEVKGLVSVVAASWILAEIIRNNKNVIQKLNDLITKVTVDFHNSFEDFKSEASRTSHEKAAIDHGQSQIEAIMTLFQVE